MRLTVAVAVYMEQLRNLQAALQEYYGRGAEGQQQMSDGFLEQQLQELIEALQTYDYDSSDAIMEKLENCDCSTELKSKLQMLREQEFQLDFDACVETAEQMLAMISSERE